MDSLFAFGNIPYTPAWYYKQFPGFYNVQCYEILSRWEHGCRTPDQVALDMMEMGTCSDRKRKLSEIDIDMQESKNKNGDVEMSESIDRNGLCTEF